MLSTMTATEVKARQSWPSRYEQLERLETASRPPAPPPASDPHPGTVAANYEMIAEVVELVIGMTNGERQTVARELAEHDREMADAFAAMILDAGHEHHAAHVASAEVTLADYVAGMVD